MKLSEIAYILENQIEKQFEEIDVAWLLTDSRLLMFPYDSLFFALKTERNDGHNYISELYQHNLRYFVISHWMPIFDKMPDAVFFKVDDTLQALQQVAAYKRKQFSIPIIGITGSNGKTIVKEWLYQLLKNDYRIVRSPKSYNSQIGVPLSVWGLNENTQLGIFETGISLPYEMEKLQPIIRPTIGVFTHLGDAHQVGFDHIETKIREKMKLFVGVDTLVYNADDTVSERIINQHFPSQKQFKWGRKTTNDLQIIHIQKEKHSTTTILNYHTKQQKITLPFTDDASIENVLHCISVLVVLGFAPQEITQRIAQLTPVAMRLEVKEGLRDSLLINDAYNLDYDSLVIALNFQANQSVSNRLSKTLILSDMPRSAFSDKELYHKVIKLINTTDIQKIIAIGNRISHYADDFHAKEKYFYPSTQEFLAQMKIDDFSQQLILFKGAREFRFEKIVAKFEKIVHQTTLDVHLNSLINNYNYFRGLLRRPTKIMCMVKAFGYGSGSVEIARTLQHHQCDYLAVAVADEGAELRNEGIRIPIVVMNPEINAFDTIFEYKLEPEIYSFGLLKSFLAAAEQYATVDYPIHIKLDTGMHRLGFLPEEVEELISILNNQHALKVRSVFSHLAAADNPDLDCFTREQIELFTTLSHRLSTSLPYPILKHILNSAGIERFHDAQFDMVRLGIGLYGVSTAPLETVCTLRTLILQKKQIKKGETVGYNRNGKITHDSTIGIIPIGYADGFDRALGNGVGEVYVNGFYTKTVGNICMDLTMIDLTDIPAEEGDVVEIFGKNIPIEEMSKKQETIPYEVLTGVSRRVKRIYYLD